MNPLTQVKWTHVINQKEALLGLSEDASWHAKLKDSAYVSSAASPSTSPRATSSPYSRRELAPPHFVTLCLTVVPSPPLGMDDLWEI
ncbi:hypothetical protein HU200_035313 [Digitaria exilis]|uniref:Uncharacterized protein n=1 Tax=Digitaria exilis TaxID=1010633 RepID=A0A835BHD4_9POAL|nr:hypothetical protein HU200_035313 [Digitaria exilis]